MENWKGLRLAGPISQTAQICRRNGAVSLLLLVGLVYDWIVILF